MHVQCFKRVSDTWSVLSRHVLSTYQVPDSLLSRNHTRTTQIGLTLGNKQMYIIPDADKNYEENKRK